MMATHYRSCQYSTSLFGGIKTVDDDTNRYLWTDVLDVLEMRDQDCMELRLRWLDLTPLGEYNTIAEWGEWCQERRDLVKKHGLEIVRAEPNTSDDESE